MESITIKVDDALMDEIEIAMKPLYSTKTEFIREAIRDKIQELRRERVVEALRNSFGKVKKKTSDRELERIRETVFAAYAKKRGITLK